MAGMDNTLDQLRELLNEAKAINNRTNSSFDFTSSNDFGYQYTDFSNQVGSSFQNDQSYNYGSNLNNFQPTFSESNYEQQFGFSNSDFQQNSFNSQTNFHDESSFYYSPNYFEQNATSGWNDHPSFSESFQTSSDFFGQTHGTQYCDNFGDGFQTSNEFYPPVKESADKFQKTLQQHQADNNDKFDALLKGQEKLMKMLNELPINKYMDDERQIEQFPHELRVSQESDDVHENDLNDNNESSVELVDTPIAGKFCESTFESVENDFLEQFDSVSECESWGWESLCESEDSISTSDLIESCNIDKADMFNNPLYMQESDDDTTFGSFNIFENDIYSPDDDPTGEYDIEPKMQDTTHDDPKIEITNLNDRNEECLNIDTIQLVSNVQCNIIDTNDTTVQPMSSLPNATNEELGTQFKCNTLPCPYFLDPRTFFLQVPNFSESHHSTSHRRTDNSVGWCDEPLFILIHGERSSHWSTEDRFLYSLTTLSS